jgi:2-polyprenyl-3-methyl-5-hydroxy-6-metoxy-1,4-benzoquinol methylase
LLALRWHARWDIIFLLDVLEHIPEERQALEQIAQALTPGGLLFMTTPALKCFWTRNDELVGHQRRYSKSDYRRLAAETGFRLLEARYFMFFLSFALLATRLLHRPESGSIQEEDPWSEVERTHRVLPPLLNTPLAIVFAAETPLGHYFSFPWGTSILAVLQKPI